MVAIGHAGGGDPSVGGGAGATGRFAKFAISWAVEGWRPWREWRTGFGTVTDALEGLTAGGFGRKEEGGKCLFL
jgi:hypothetical protein